MVKYTLEQRIFLYDSYVKKKSYESCKRKFRRRYPGVRIPASSTILRLVKKVRSTGSLLDKKYTRQNAVLTEETLDKIGARLEHSPRKSLARLAQEAQVSKTTAWRATKNLHLRPSKITQEEPCNVITVKEELKDEVTTEEYEVQPEQVNDSPIQSPTTDRSEDRLKCEVCGKLLSHRASLINHVRTHTGEKPFKCETCGKVFSVCGQLTRHHRTHTGEKPFKCDICGKEYTQKEHVVTHQRTHTGEKPFKCEVCGKAFYARGHLVTHRRIHTGEKPFVCEVCGKAFPWKGPLSAHYRTHFHQKPSEYGIIGEGSAQSATYLPAATVIGLSNADLT